jgi:ribosomal protein S18 acetylase RimI-like enzyme
MALEGKTRISVGSARPDELVDALHLIFQQATEKERRRMVANLSTLIRQGEVQANGILVARRGSELIGGMVCQPVAGAGSLIWPPQVMAGQPIGEIEDRLLILAKNWLRSQGAKLSQALLRPEETVSLDLLKRHGFHQVTNLWYLRHQLQDFVPSDSRFQQLELRRLGQVDGSVFQQTLLRTYEQTLDCPELNGVRSIEEIMEGHRAQGIYRPDAWLMAVLAGQPAGILILNEMTEGTGWEIAYLGVIPEARRQGIGLALAGEALRIAGCANALQLTLSVDERNQPAWKLYRRLGFEPYDQRQVYLAIWNK